MSDIRSVVNENVSKTSADNFKKNVEQAKIQPKEVKSTVSEKETNRLNKLNNVESFPTGVVDIKLSVTIKSDKDVKKIDLSNYVRTLQIHKAYEMLFKPIYLIEMRIPASICYILEKTPSDPTYDLVINISNSLEYTPTGVYNIPEISKDMKNMVNVKLKSYTTNLPKTLISNMNTENNAMNTVNEKDVTYIVEAFNINHLNTNNSLFSFNYRNQHMQNIITHIINQNKATCMPNINKLVFCPPDVTEAIDNITVPPKCLREVLEYLQTNFNIYNRKAIFFVDDDTLYITKRSYSPVLKDKKSNVQIDLGLDYIEYTKYEHNTATDDAKLYRSSSYEISNNYKAAMNELGNKVVIKSDSDIVGIRSSCIGLKDNSDIMASIKNSSLYTDSTFNGKEKFIKDNTSSRLKLNLLVDEAQAKSLEIRVSIQYADINDFKPTSLIYLNFLDDKEKQFSGVYYVKELVSTYSVGGFNNSDISNEFLVCFGRKYDDKGNVVV